VSFLVGEREQDLELRDGEWQEGLRVGRSRFHQAIIPRGWAKLDRRSIYLASI